jgi:hypothetical protein
LNGRGGARHGMSLGKSNKNKKWNEGKRKSCRQKEKNEKGKGRVVARKKKKKRGGVGLSREEKRGGRERGL